MDNQEQVDSPLLNHKSIDWIDHAETLIPTYSERLIRYIEKHDNKLDESDFIEDEIQEFEVRLMPKNQFTVGKKWKLFKKTTNIYLKFLKEKRTFFSDELSIEERTQKRTNYIKIYCLKKFAPDLWNRIHRLTKEEKAIVIHNITGINKRDCYTFFNNSIKNEDWAKGFIDGEVLDKIVELEFKLM
jgi:hypothetical protein